LDHTLNRRGLCKTFGLFKVRLYFAHIGRSNVVLVSGQDDCCENTEDGNADHHFDEGKSRGTLPSDFMSSHGSDIPRKVVAHY